MILKKFFQNHLYHINQKKDSSEINLSIINKISTNSNQNNFNQYNPIKLLEYQTKCIELMNKHILNNPLNQKDFNKRFIA